MDLLKKILLLVGSIGLLSGVCLAEPTEKAIVIKDNASEVAIGSTAVSEQDGLLIPAAVIKERIYSNAVLDEVNSQLKVNFPEVRFKIVEGELDNKISRNNTMVIPYKLVNSVPYIDAVVAARIYGFDVEEQADKVVLWVSKYNAYDERLLNSNPTPEKLDKVVLTWQPVINDKVDVSKEKKINGLNVVSPSWLEITGEDGFVSNKADYRYVKTAKSKGYQVWPLITNSFDPVLTNKVLNNKVARDNVVKQLVTYAKLYDFDGINLDFEHIYDSDKVVLNLFVKEICDAFRTMGLRSSIDVTVPSSISLWSLCYDRKSLSESVDYIMLMAYDEYWSISPVSGPVASIGWVEQGIIGTLKEVPAEKVVLGVPFYMREWSENLRGDKNAKSRTMTMEQAGNKIKELNLAPQWIDKGGHYYFEYKQNDKLYRVWQEEERSMKLKIALVNKYNLAGVAAWRNGFEKPEIWQVIYDTLFEQKKGQA